MKVAVNCHDDEPDCRAKLEAALAKVRETYKGAQLSLEEHPKHSLEDL